MNTFVPLNQFPAEVQAYFPFTPRPGQTLMAHEIYYGVLNQRQIALEGSAGMGKTITCLSALLPFCRREGYILLYSARTHTQIQRVIEELTAIQKIKGQPFTGMTVYGRETMCLHPSVQSASPHEAMELCQALRRAKQCEWYETLKQREIDRVTGCFTSQYLKDFGTKTRVCPYYLGKRLQRHCTVLALTYNYLINPFIRNVLLKTLKISLDRCILVFDECHNLPEFAMQAMSDGLSNRGIARALRETARYEIAKQFPRVQRFLFHIQRYFKAIQAEYGISSEELEIGIDPKEVQTYFQEFTESEHISLTDLMTECRALGSAIREQKLKAHLTAYSSIYHIGEFLNKFYHTAQTPQYLHYLILNQDRLQYYIRCIDCREILRPLQQARSIISMSGTLEPIPAYLEICGFPPQTRQKVLPSPFNHRAIKVLAIRGIDVSYYSRGIPSYQVITARCLEVIRATPGNVAIFCASYNVLNDLLTQTNLLTEIEALARPFYKETRKLSSKENDEMVTRYKADGHAGRKAILMGVCGGRNSEGVDFPGVEMISVVIVGVPLARLTHSTQALIKYYTEQFGVHKGREYAYVLPALRRTNQAAGRPIRTLRDYGIIILLDERYTYPYYRRFLSNWLNENMIILPNKAGTLQREIEQFYQLHSPQPRDPLRNGVNAL
ncbi:MAG: ATP-dependent DNA helicase [Candidatus Helarchaeota archaeon]